jgi:hypothetical protein
MDGKQRTRWGYNWRVSAGIGSPTIAQVMARESRQSQESAMGQNGTFSEDKGI